ncbi:DNA polymerase III subunit alpha [Candidatus Falkowbacteria bacterium]|nr:DNA polymerase III subunit alpha [Candidatus Falkowbacteria bacterium]
MKFVHLHNHTHYSLLDGLSKIDDLIETAKQDGASAVAITDHGVMYGAVEFYQKCKKAGIKPIIGVEAYLAPESRLDKNTKSDEKHYHLLLLAKNLEGYKNLIKLTTIAHLEGFYYKPRIDWEVLQKHGKGLIASTACVSGEIPSLILAGKIDKARKRITEYNELFGQGNFYLEIQDHPDVEGQAEANKKMIEFSRELGVPLVATNDSHYLKPEDYDIQDILLCLQTKHKKEDRDRMEMHGRDFYYKTSREMSEAFRDVPEALENTVKIAEACDLELELGKIQLPHFEVPAGMTGDEYLRKLCEEGLEKKYGVDFRRPTSNKTSNKEDVGRLKERMDYELEVIKKMGWPSYFLIVADFVNWAKTNGIVVGPGRGSAAGSLVCFLAGITNLDPIKYDLLFERFLNPDRISMPDIDMDFSDIRRGEVIRYVEEKYGSDHVAQIITFGTMAARAAVRDVGRVMNYPYDYCDRLAKMIPMFSKIDQAIRDVAEVKEIYKTEEAAKKIFDYARGLEGVARHASTHACGVLITKDPLTDHVPLQYASSSDRTIVSQYSLHPVEDLGLLKMDFLGLKNLTIIEGAVKIIKNTRGLAIDIDNIPLDDKKTFKLFQDGETTGVFQFKSSGMKRYLKELKPTEFEDIIAMVALYRPGPMEWIPDYISGKHGRKKPQYLHPKLEPILKKTYGVALYQEQVMQMARDLAGFSMAEADVLRKAVGKKISKLLAEQKEKFVDGCVKNGIASQLAGKIFSFIEPFAGYGFNRSHAACYALIGYQTAYLKAHWPTEFMAALLTAEQNDIDRIAILIEECRHMGIEVNRPDINQSFGSFTVVTSGTEENKAVGEKEKVNTIRFGLKAIKNVGEHIAEVIINDRKENGPFEDITDLLERITDKDMNKKSLESLVKSGALDKFGERGQLLGNMENFLNFSKEIGKSKSSRQSSLFADAPILNMSHKIKLAPAKPAGRQEQLAWEKELLGVYITEHPFGDYKKRLEKLITPLVDLPTWPRDEQATAAGVIATIKKIITRTNESMLFVKIEDGGASIELLVFPSLLKETADIWREGKAVLCQGKISDKDREIKLLVNKAAALDLEKMEESINVFKTTREAVRNGNGWAKRNYEPYYPPLSSKNNEEDNIKFTLKEGHSADMLDGLRQILLKHKGRSKVYFKITQNGAEKTIETAWRADKTGILREPLNNLFGGFIILDK